MSWILWLNIYADSLKYRHLLIIINILYHLNSKEWMWTFVLELLLMENWRIPWNPPTNQEAWVQKTRLSASVIRPTKPAHKSDSKIRLYRKSLIFSIKSIEVSLFGDVTLPTKAFIASLNGLISKSTEYDFSNEGCREQISNEIGCSPQWRHLWMNLFWSSLHESFQTTLPSLCHQYYYL